MSTTKLFIAATLLILSLAGLLMAFIIGTSSNPAPVYFRLGLGLGSAVMATISIIALARMDRNHKREAIKEFQQQPEETLASWQFPIEHWRALTRYEGKRKRGLSPWYGLAGGLVSGGLVLLFFFGSFGPGAIILSLIAGLAFGIVVGCLSYAHGEVTEKSKLADREAKVAIRPDGMLINENRFIHWNSYGAYLTGMILKRFSGLPFFVLEVNIKQRAGSRTVSFTHRVPVPETHLAQAEGLVALFAGNA